MEAENSNIALSVVKIGVLFLVGVLLLSSINASSATYSQVIRLAENPSDGDTVTVDGTVYEFDLGDGVSGGHTAVQLAYTLELTARNLRNALAASGYDVVVA